MKLLQLLELLQLETDVLRITKLRDIGGVDVRRIGRVCMTRVVDRLLRV